MPKFRVAVEWQLTVRAEVDVAADSPEQARDKAMQFIQSEGEVTTTRLDGEKHSDHLFPYQAPVVTLPPGWTIDEDTLEMGDATAFEVTEATPIAEE